MLITSFQGGFLDPVELGLMYYNIAFRIRGYRPIDGAIHGFD